MQTDKTNVEIAEEELGYGKFHERYELRGASEGSLKTYADLLGALRRMAGKPLLELTEDEIKALDRKLLRRGAVYRTILCMFYLANKRHDVFDNNVLVKRKHKEARRMSLDDILMPDDIAKLVGAATNLRDAALVVTLAGTGARIGEIVDLKVKDLKATNDGGYQVFIGKKVRGQERYSPPITGSYKATLDKWLTAIPDRTGDSWLFPSTKFGDAMHMNKTTAWQLLTGNGENGQQVGLRIKAGIAKRCNPHAFRHHRATIGVIRKEDTATLCIGLWGIPVTKSLNRYSHFMGLSVTLAESKMPSLDNLPALPRAAVTPEQVRLARLEEEMREFRKAKPEIRTTEDFDELRARTEEIAVVEWNSKSPAEKNVAALEQERDEMRERMAAMEATLAALLKETAR